MKLLKDCTNEDLSDKLDHVRRKIENNDGRLTVGSSYELDDLLDQLEYIENELRLREIAH